jgi:hypothetical protein
MGRSMPKAAILLSIRLGLAAGLAPVACRETGNPGSVGTPDLPAAGASAAGIGGGSAGMARTSGGGTGGSADSSGGVGGSSFGGGGYGGGGVHSVGGAQSGGGAHGLGGAPGICASHGLGAQVVSHACLHSMHGPFATLIPAAAPALAPPLATHTAYELPLDAGISYARFSASSAGWYAVFGEGPRDIELLSASPRNQRLGTTVCSALPWFIAIELEQADAVELRFRGPWPAMLVLEPLSSFGEGAWICAESCRELQAGCSGDADCCSGFCGGGFCEQEPLGCSDKGAVGAPCRAAIDCCSGLCEGEVCAVRAECRSEGPCTSHSECCEFCHDMDHCH